MEAILSRSVLVFSPQCAQVRGMATLKDIRVRLKSVSNIQKITKSMKMVSAAKYARAERELKPARPYGLGAKSFYEKAEITQDASQPNHLIVAMTSDRGLCGGVHTNVVKQVRALMVEQKPGIETKLVLIGDKAKAMLQKQYSKNIMTTFNDIGKRPPVFADAALIANDLLESGYKHDHGLMLFNVFRSVVAYRTTKLPLYSLDTVNNSEKINVYDSLDEEVVRSYNEFSLASLLFYALKEGACSEQSSRMTSMDAASKNAGEMIDKLTLTYNRTRQAVITRELIEIISGASALQ